MEACRFYLLDAWVRRASADGAVQLMYRWEMDNGEHRYGLIAYAESHEWTYAAMVVRAPTEARLLRLHLLVEGCFSAGEWDDVTVLELAWIPMHDWNTCGEQVSIFSALVWASLQYDCRAYVLLPPQE